MSRDPFDDGGARLLTEDQRERVAAWVRASADMLGLRDWRIHVSPYSAGSGNLGANHVRDDAEVAWIALGPQFLDHAPHEQLTTLTHELLHCHVQPIIRMFERLLDGELGTRAESLMGCAVERVEERSIDRLASGLATLLPPFSLEPLP